MEEPSSALENQSAHSNHTPSGILFMVILVWLLRKYIYIKKKETGLSQFMFFSQLTLSLSKIEYKKKTMKDSPTIKPRYAY